MIIILLLLLISTIEVPVEYKGWINNCSLYFQPNSATQSSIQELFVQCHTHICQDYYLMSCDRYALQKKESLAECMKLCCNEQSQYHQFLSVLGFLQECQEDFLKKKNKAATMNNRLPLKILFYSFLGLALLLIICIAYAYSDEIMEWGRQRLTNRNRNDAGIQLRNLLT